ncbi:MAG: hypothetical protein AB7E21_17385, partial [Pseudodonghicola sp.]
TQAAGVVIFSVKTMLISSPFGISNPGRSQSGHAPISDSGADSKNLHTIRYRLVEHRHAGQSFSHERRKMSPKG